MLFVDHSTNYLTPPFTFAVFPVVYIAFVSHAHAVAVRVQTYPYAVIYTYVISSDTLI